MKNIVVTYGDLNGIGFEIMVKALNALVLPIDKVKIVGSPKVFSYYDKNYNLKLKKDYEIIDVELSENAFNIGKENVYSGEHCFLCLKKACELVNNKKASSIVTAPVSKHVLNMAGHNFSGQTEVLEHFLAEKNEKSEMLFVADDFKILLLTRHIALNNISKSITKKMIQDKIIRLNEVLINSFNIKKPKIGLLALNPHAGENGILGTEEISIIKPAIHALIKENINIEGPLVADAAFAKFGKCYFEKKPLPYDCYVAMYHDQGLIPMKLLAQDTAINTTIGLSAIRTSPSHGTAFDIAGKNIANANSMIEAIKLAIKI